MPPLINSYGRYLEETYGTVVYRIGVDAGFSCPHRSPDGSGGCLFCDPSGSRSAYINAKHNLKEQISRSVSSMKRRYNAQNFILYFQAFTGTYAPVENLREIYDYGLGQENFRELIISTRGDCLDEEKCRLIASYKKRGLDVWVELGLQTIHNPTLERVNRGETLEDFKKGWSLIKKHGINGTIHLIFGLPGETHDQIMESVDFAASLNPRGIKIHNLHIPVKSVLYEEYKHGELSFPSSQRHLEYLADAVERLPPETLLMRISTDTPEQRSGQAPGFFWSKNRFYALLEQELIRRGSRQGQRYKPS